MLRFWLRLLVVVCLLSTAPAERVARAQEEEAEAQIHPQAVAAEVQIVQNVNTDQVDQWVFGRFGGAAGTRTKLDSALALKIDELERLCGLTESQKKKLLLAGRGDIKRFFDRVEELKRKFVANQNGMNQNIWQDLQPLQGELNTGLFDEESLYAKMIKRILSSDQAVHYERQLHERRLCAIDRRSSGSSCTSTRRWDSPNHSGSSSSTCS